MAGFYAPVVGNQRLIEADQMELDHFQPNDNQMFNTNMWTASGGDAWSGTLAYMPVPPTLPPTRSVYQNDSYTQFPTGPYALQTEYPNQQGAMTINPQSLQIPDMGRRSSFDSPFPQQTFHAANVLDDGTDRSIGISEPPSDLFVDDFGEEWDGMAVTFLGDMGSLQQPASININDSFPAYQNTQATEPSSVEAHSVSKQKQKRLNDNQTTKLRNWFYLHILNPYPDPDQLCQLQHETQLTTQQIRNWFARSRQRKLPNDPRPREPNASMKHVLSRQMSFASDRSRGRRRESPSTAKGSVESLNCYRATIAPRSQDGSVHSFSSNPKNIQPSRTNWVDIGGKVDIIWWLSNVDDGNAQQKDPAQRPRAPTITIDTSHLQLDIMMTVADDVQELEPGITASPTGLVPDFSDAGSEHATPAPSRHSSCRSNSSVRSLRSHQSTHSGSSSAVHGSRKGRRRVANPARSPSQASSLREYAENEIDMKTRGTGGDKFCCHLCAETFGRKSSLNRHLKTIHGWERRPWICNMLNFGSADMPQCCFCLLDGSQQECQHRISVCEGKLEKERSFWRRDHFMQHLEGVHKVPKELVQTREIDLDQWRAPATKQEVIGTDTPGAGGTDPTPKPLVRIGTGERIHKAISSMSRHFKIGQSSSSLRR